MEPNNFTRISGDLQLRRLSNAERLVSGFSSGI